MITLFKKFVYISISFLILIFLFFSCKKGDVFSNIPEIEYKDIALIVNKGIDSGIVVTFKYKDGDGDIGYPDEDPVNQSIFVYYYKKRNGVYYLKIKPDSSLNLNGKLSMLLNEGIKRPIKGEIEYTIGIYTDFSVLKYDTVFFELYLQDRALNKSNLIKTPEIVVKKKL